MITLSVIIVNYNTRDMTLECLRTLTEGLEDRFAEILLVDNGSTDGSADAIASAFPSVTLIRSQKNLGFGAGNNVALRQAQGKYLLLLNSDAFPRTGALPALVQHLDKHPDVGVVGPRLLNADGSLQISCFRYPSPVRAWLENMGISSLLRSHPTIGDYRRWPHDSEREVDWVIGACLLVRREVYEQIGGFDERFFMYAEETDWQARMRDAGWKIGFTPAAKVTHLGGASGKDQRVKINEHFFKSLDLYERKHHGRIGMIALHCAMIMGSALRMFLLLPAAIVPMLRSRALAKLKMHRWLLVRQITTWTAPMDQTAPIDQYEAVLK